MKVMTELKPCPFCGTPPHIKVAAYQYPPGCFVSACVYCPECKCITNNLASRKDYMVQQSVFWTDKEILKHVPQGLQLYSGAEFNVTTARAAKAKARETVIALWQKRIAAEATGEDDG